MRKYNKMTLIADETAIAFINRLFIMIIFLCKLFYDFFIRL